MSSRDAADMAWGAKVTVRTASLPQGPPAQMDTEAGTQRPHVQCTQGLPWGVMTGSQVEHWWRRIKNQGRLPGGGDNE